MCERGGRDARYVTGLVVVPGCETGSRVRMHRAGQQSAAVVPAMTCRCAGLEDAMSEDEADAVIRPCLVLELPHIWGWS